MPPAATLGTTSADPQSLHDNGKSKSSGSPTTPTRSSLVTTTTTSPGNDGIGTEAGTAFGQSVIKAAKAAYEQKIKAAASGSSSTTAATVANKVHFNGAKSDVLARVGAGAESDERTEKEKVPEESGSGFGDGPEVFLGGSCNPTTWRADVARPTLNTLGISFYNPQVSDWTPDLIELEHRAKEKARVLFFVMDSETRATAGAIEAAHIAGLNTKQLVLVLHPYKPDQKILNETVSKQ